MDTIIIPVALIDSPEFNAIQWGDQKFLWSLYAVFNEAERFTIELTAPEAYRQSKGVTMQNRISRLIKSGLLQVVDRQKSGKYHFRRVFSFKYKAVPSQGE